MISVAIIARDSEKTIKKCLESLSDLSNDIVVVVDDRNSDSTYELIKSYTNNIFTHKFSDFSSQKNYAISKTKHEWVLSLDADEELTPELLKELKNFSPKHDAYLVNRKNIIFGKVINHTNWDPDGILRLFDKTKAEFQGLVHEQVITKGTTGKLNSSIIHHNYSTVEEFISKLNKYTTVENKYTFPPLEFFKRFIWHAGFSDGWHGLFLSYLMTIYHITIWAKLSSKTKS